MPSPDANGLITIFDGHNDTLLKLEIEAAAGRDRSFFELGSRGHIDLPRARAGGFAGGLFAMFVPSNLSQDFSRPFDPKDPANYAEIAQGDALAFTLKLMSRAVRLERDSNGAVVVCRTVSQIRNAMAAGRLAVSLHMEGAEAIDTDFHALDVLYAGGLRSIGPVWSRPNAYADGVPMAFPASPDTGPGLTDAGRALVRACNSLGVLVDLSHLTEKGFWDVAAVTGAPLVASHSNAHALCENARNLTDRQLDAIRESNGLVGVNFHIAFLRPDGRHAATKGIDLIVRHTAYLVERLGEDRVGFGSDFDGCLPPADLRDAASLPDLMDALLAAGFDRPLLEKLAFGNWLSVLERTQA